MGKKSLDGLTAIDLSQYLAGPYSSELLATHGAEVINVEPPGGGQERQGDGPIFSIVGRGKKSVAIDLNSSRGKKVLEDLVAEADIFIHNYGPDSVKKLGFSYEDVREINDEMIYISITACGESGPYADRPGFDPIAQAMSGLMCNTGEKDRKPSRVGSSPIDIATGIYAAFAAISAIHERRQTNTGQKVEISLLDTAAEIMGWMYSKHSLGHELQRLGHAWKAYAPCGIMNTADDPIYIAAFSQDQWKRLCESLDRTDWLENPLFESHEARTENRSKLHDAIEDEFNNYHREELIPILVDAGVPAGEVQSVSDAISDPHLRERGTIIDVPYFDGEEVTITTTPLFYPEDNDKDNSPYYPEVGENSKEILSDIGYERGDIKSLTDDGVIQS